MAEEIKHKDLFDRVLSVGSAVVFPIHNSMKLGMVSKINPKMVRVTTVPMPGHYNKSNGYLKYSKELVIVDGPEVTMYILKNSTK
jgi:hypothetical protein